MPKARIIGRDKVISIGKADEERLEHSRRRGQPVEQENRWALLRSRFPIKNGETVNLHRAIEDWMRHGNRCPSLAFEMTGGNPHGEECRPASRDCSDCHRPQNSWAVGRRTTSSISTSAGCSMAYSTARATESAGIAIFLYRSVKNAAEDGSEVPFFSSDSTAPGEMIVQRMFSACSSIRSPSVKARTADFVAQYTVPPGANTLIPKTEAMLMM